MQKCYPLFLFFEKHNIYNKHISYIMEQNIEQQVTRGIGAQQSQSLRDYPFPTEIIALPSKGLIYPESNPLAKGEITIKLMTAKEEDILTSTNLIKKGIQLDKMLESIVVEPGVNINDLSVGDKNAILVSTRLLAFGADYLINVIDKVTREESEVIISSSFAVINLIVICPFANGLPSGYINPLDGNEIISVGNG